MFIRSFDSELCYKFEQGVLKQSEIYPHHNAASNTITARLPAIILHSLEIMLAIDDGG